MSESIVLDATHRLSEHDLNEPSEASLVHAVSCMADRATASLDAISEGFEMTSQTQLANKTIYFLLQSAMMEITDIQALIEANAEFYQAEQAQSVQEKNLTGKKTPL